MTKLHPAGWAFAFSEFSAEDIRFIAEVLDAHTLSKLATEYLQTLEKDRGMNWIVCSRQHLSGWRAKPSCPAGLEDSLGPKSHVIWGLIL